MTNYLIGAITGFGIGVLGNLVAAWVQADMLQNSFTPVRLFIILLLTIIGVLVGYSVERSSNTNPPRLSYIPDPSKNRLSQIRLMWSRVGIKGKGNTLENVKSIGSDIDIDSGS